MQYIYMGLWDYGTIWEIEKRDRRTSTKINAVIVYVHRNLSKSEQYHWQKWNNRKVVIKITGLKPLWLFLASSWPVMQNVGDVCVTMVCCIQLPPAWVSRLEWETVGVDGVVGAICWAGLVGEVKGSFCELFSLVFVGCNWLVLRLWFGLCLLRGSWSGVGLV